MNAITSPSIDFFNARFDYLILLRKYNEHSHLKSASLSHWSDFQNHFTKKHQSANQLDKKQIDLRLFVF